MSCIGPALIQVFTLILEGRILCAGISKHRKTIPNMNKPQEQPCVDGSVLYLDCITIMAMNFAKCWEETR
jgi:hypothetical protein